MQVWCSSVFKSRHRLSIIGLSLGILTLLLFGLTMVQLVCLAHYRFPVKPGPILIELPVGSSLTQFANQLLAHDLLSFYQKKWFIFLVKITGCAHRLQSGEYAVTSSMTVWQLVQKVVEGRVFLHKVTFPEGIVFQDMISILGKHPHIKAELIHLPEAHIRTELGITARSIEGVFYPDTYLFAKGTPDKVILKQALERMRTVVKNEWQQRALNVLYRSPYEALIAASLVEKETADDRERYKIAGVIANRLRLNMLLQIDPTVIYGMGTHYSGRLLRTDLKYDSPYNTYLYRGLPPSPIALTSRESLHAALHPLETESLYYVSRGDGTHLFARSLEEHLQNIQWVKKGQVQQPIQESLHESSF